jgi:hypothetical protein
VAKRSEEFRKIDVEVIAVAMSKPEWLARYLMERQPPFPIFADPDRTAYAAFGLGRTSWGRLFRPGIIWGYLKFIARGWKVKPIPEGEDALQLGGDFILDADRRLRWAYRGANPLDRPSVDDLLNACKLCGSGA